MKIISKIQNAVAEDRIFFSYEYFPPKTEAGVENLYDRIDRMAQQNPAFVDITWGAGGSTAELTLQIATSIQNLIGVETMMHMTCTNMPKEKIRETLQIARRNGIQNILALRGDPPRGAESWEQCADGFSHAVDLVRFIREEHGDYFGICVAGYPEKHQDAVSYEEDLKYLKEKVDAGADVIVTQLFYDCDIFLKFVKDCRELGIKCPIIPGIMPIQNYASFKRMANFCQTSVPADVEAALEKIKDNDEAVRDYGIELGITMSRYLLDHGIRGLHFYTLNLEKSVASIIEGLGLNPTAETSPTRTLPWRTSSSSKRERESVRPIFWANRPKSYLARTMGWDEFPNGRWGDSRSPAFGDLSDYHLAGLHTVKNIDRKQMWGEAPATLQDIYNVFVGYLEGKVTSLPWIDNALSPETNMICQNLLALNKSGFLTINSQPRINGAKSDDPQVGWGGPGGYVYQKEYLEFFVSPENFAILREVLPKYQSLTYHATNVAGELNGNDFNVNAVTWGVFPGREVIQPTIVDTESFMAWKDEAFGLWMWQWARIYEQGSASYELVKKIHDTWYLVNIVDNDFVGGDIYRAFQEVISRGNPEAPAQ